jgi:putative ABC transport system ATP-binding protein
VELLLHDRFAPAGSAVWFKEKVHRGIMDGQVISNREFAGDQTAAGTAPAVEARALGQRVPVGDGELTILADVAFSIAPGEAVAIVGASGSGKSTLLSLLAGLDVPSDGAVHLAGAALSTLDEDGRARIRAGRVGFVFQSFQLLPALNALENVMLPLELAGVDDAAPRATEILTRVGLGARLRHYPRQLSGGEQQRVALARAFVTRPQVLFADEPTGNLDTATGQSVIELLFELNRQSGTTLILVTHDEQLAARCPRLLRLDSGRLVADERRA